ncbi:16S rRNA (guanine(966)-N(2))-methyltransferase RsmD [Hyphomonas sp.]|jgi:16S rRNA (guanine966-N2)-methyltransferase|uniref:16S rRNA (guanine(966)-N(2))-methyltransferase RsmD n=1 Tax=Hyphomonas sp. TaxID=87 RepID=UPI0032D94F56
MRIIAGEHKGRAIAAPKGQGTRPTGDRARESIFNMLAHADWAPEIDGARVIDLFAGSGALGLEAMSRGAAFCLFVETDHGARGAIRDNIETLGLFGNTRLHRRSATDLGDKPASAGAPFTLAFLDPPYNKSLVEPALAGLVSGKWLIDDALAVVETGVDETITPKGWETVETRDYGAARIWFLKRA